MKKVLLLLSLILLLAACSSSKKNSTELIPLRLPMGYIPDPQYAPFYVAAERGYFAEAGYEIEFDYLFETDGIALVGTGELPFAVVSGEQIILSRAQEVPVVYVLEWFQKYPIAIVSKADTGIETPQDLIGRTLGLPGFFGASYVGYIGLLNANGLTQDDVPANDIGFTQYETIRNDQIDAAIVYINNEPVQLTQDGEAINVIAVSDYIDMVANGIITNETMIAEHPEQVEAFVHALLHGIADTLADPDAAYEISKQYVEGLEDDRKPILLASLELWQPETILGFSEPDSWVATQAVLIEMGFLEEGSAELSHAYTNQFITTYQK